MRFCTVLNQLINFVFSNYLCMQDNDIEEAFLQAPDPKDVEKKSCNKKGAGIGVALVIGVLAVIALLVGLFCRKLTSSNYIQLT